MNERTKLITPIIARAAVSVSVNTPDSDIGAGWNPLDFFTEFRTTPVNMSLDLNGVIKLGYKGNYQIAITGHFTHNVSGTERDTSLRAWNITKAIAGPVAWTLPTEKSARSTSIVLVTPFDITDEFLDDAWRIEVGGVDIYTSVVWQTLIFSVWSHGRIVHQPQ